MLAVRSAGTLMGWHANRSEGAFAGISSVSNGKGGRFQRRGDPTLEKLHDLPSGRVKFRRFAKGRLPTSLSCGRLRLDGAGERDECDHAEGGGQDPNQGDRFDTGNRRRDEGVRQTVSDPKSDGGAEGREGRGT